jgi:hypothetical protein
MRLFAALCRNHKLWTLLYSDVPVLKFQMISRGTRP